MKVLMINGSPKENGCTYTALTEIANILKEESIETEILQLGTEPIRDCIGCRACKKTGKGRYVYSFLRSRPPIR